MKPVERADGNHRSARPASRTRATLIIAGAAALAGVVGFAVTTWLTDVPSPPPSTVLIGDGANGPRDMAWIPGGEFLMGSDHNLAQPNERPTHRVRVRGFWMDRTHVTNAQFRAFVDATGYVTTAERKPEWESLRVQLPAGTPRPPDEALVPGALVFIGSDAPVDLRDVSQWWTFVPGANWRSPTGPGSDIAGKDDHPVVQVSHEDVLAYADWVGKRLPTEAEWEFAARGGLEQATYAWGEEYQPGGQAMANVWESGTQGRFPVVSPKAGGAAGTLRVGTFPANGYGLVDMTGNAWQWTADWYRSDYFALQKQQSGDAVIADPRGPADSWDPDDQLAIANAPRRVIRGGSFLCNQDYCLSYRPSARRGNDPFNPMNHIGFRLVKDAGPAAGTTRLVNQ
jgi:sulfatase modifying factor 1